MDILEPKAVKRGTIEIGEVVIPYRYLVIEEASEFTTSDFASKLTNEASNERNKTNKSNQT